MKHIEIEIRLDTEDFITGGYPTDATLVASYELDRGNYGSNETARPPYLSIDKFEVRDNNNRDITDLLLSEILDDLTERYLV